MRGKFLFLILSLLLVGCTEEEQPSSGSSVTTLTPGEPQSNYEDFSPLPENVPEILPEEELEEEPVGEDGDEALEVETSLSEEFWESEDFAASWQWYLGEIDHLNQQISLDKNGSKEGTADFLLELASVLRNAEKLTPPSEMAEIFGEFVLSCERIAIAYEAVADYLGKEVPPSVLANLSSEVLEETENFYKSAVAVTSAMEP